MIFNDLRRLKSCLAGKVFLFSFLFWPSHIHAQKADSLLDFESAYPALKRVYHFENFYNLSSNNCDQVLVDTQGFLWIATGDGLNKFDGYKFSFYRNSLTDSGSISGNDITILFQDSFERLWVGTYGNGLNLFDREHDRFHRYRHDPKDSTTLIDNIIMAMFEDHRGGLWVWTRGGLNKVIREGDASAKFCRLQVGAFVEMKKLVVLR